MRNVEIIKAPKYILLPICIWKECMVKNTIDGIIKSYGGRKCELIAVNKIIIVYAWLRYDELGDPKYTAESIHDTIINLFP